MSTADVTYTFVNGAGNYTDADEVNQNFTDLVNFLNNNVVHVDGSNAMTGILELPATDPTTSNQATRKSYVDAIDTALTRKVPTITGTQIGTATSYASGTTVATVTITDPGYDIEVWGWATVHASASASPSWWQLQILVDGAIQSTLVVPFVELAPGIGQSIGVPLRRTAHSTGTNCSVTVKLVGSAGTITLGAASGSGFDDCNYCEFQYRKNG